MLSSIVSRTDWITSITHTIVVATEVEARYRLRKCELYNKQAVVHILFSEKNKVPKGGERHSGYYRRPTSEKGPKSA